MENLLKVVKSLMELNDVNEITIKKVEDKKIEIWEGPRYVGRYLFKNSPELQKDLNS